MHFHGLMSPAGGGGPRKRGPGVDSLASLLVAAMLRRVRPCPSVSVPARVRVRPCLSVSVPSLSHLLSVRSVRVRPSSSVALPLRCDTMYPPAAIHAGPHSFKDSLFPQTQDLKHILVQEVFESTEVFRALGISPP